MAAPAQRGHGWVTPNPRGIKARCGGPAICQECRDELIVAGLAAFVKRKRAHSVHAFGPGPRTAGVIDHIKRELAEIEAEPGDLSEWVDVILLALDGAWRAGHEPEAVAAAVLATQSRNEARRWPDWRTADRDKAIEHVR